MMEALLSKWPNDSIMQSSPSSDLLITVGCNDRIMDGSSSDADMDHDRQASTLTPPHREFLVSLAEEKPSIDPDSSGGRSLRTRMRKRIVEGLRDWHLIFERLPDHDLNLVSRSFESRHQFDEALASAIAFVYRATDADLREGEESAERFINVIERGITLAEQRRVDPTEEIEVDVTLSQTNIDIKSTGGTIDNSWGYGRAKVTAVLPPDDDRDELIELLDAIARHNLIDRNELGELVAESVEAAEE